MDLHCMEMERELALRCPWETGMILIPVLILGIFFFAAVFEAHLGLGDYCKSYWLIHIIYNL